MERIRRIARTRRSGTPLRAGLAALAWVALTFGAGACLGYRGDAPTCPDGGTDLDWVGFAGPFYADYCTRCHSSDLEGLQRQGAPGAYDFDTYEGAVAYGITDETHLGPVWEQAGQLGFMPPNSFVRPSQQDLADLGEWLACGQPE